MDQIDKYKAELGFPLANRWLNRRQFLQRAGMGFGALSLASLLGNELFAPAARAAEVEANLQPRIPPLPAKAKRVVHIFAQGAPSTWTLGIPNPP